MCSSVLRVVALYFVALRCVTLWCRDCATG